MGWTRLRPNDGRSWGDLPLMKWIPRQAKPWHSSTIGGTGHVGTRTDSKWDTILPRWDTDVAACQIGGRVVHTRRLGGRAASPEPSEQAGASNHAQTSFLQSWVRRKGVRLENSLYRFRECPDHRFLSRQLVPQPEAASGKRPGIRLASVASWDDGKAMRRVLPIGIDASSAPRPKRSR
jgi:hypothetical protein